MRGQGAEEVENYCLMGTEFQFCKMKTWMNGGDSSTTM